MPSETSNADDANAPLPTLLRKNSISSDVGRSTWNDKDVKALADATTELPPKSKLQGSVAKVLSALRIESLLKRCKVFQEMENAVVKKVALMSEQATYPAGTVLFREGDPPGNCYMILSGRVGVFVKNPATEEPSDANAADSGTMRCSEQTKSTSNETPEIPRGSGHPCRVRRSLSIPAFGKDVTHLQDMVTRAQTVEGFSLYHAGSDLGVQVATLQGGGIVGEIAFMQEQLRTASIKCLADTEFVVVGKHAFENLLRAEMVRAREEKFEFLKGHLPGMRALPAISHKCRRPHASFFFSKFSYAKGHEFLTQGHVAEACLFVVHQGTIEFRRCESNPRYHSNQRQDRCSTPTRSCRLGRFSLEDSTRKKEFRVGLLLRGGFFGSLPLTDLREPEPFTASAATCVDVFSVPSVDISRLPRRLVEIIREYLMQATTSRLERLRNCRSIQSFPEKSPPGLRRSKSLGNTLHLPVSLPQHQESKQLSHTALGFKRACSQPILRLSSAPACGRGSNATLSFGGTP